MNPGNKVLNMSSTVLIWTQVFDVPSSVTSWWETNHVPTSLSYQPWWGSVNCLYLKLSFIPQRHLMKVTMMDNADNARFFSGNLWLSYCVFYLSFETLLCWLTQFCYSVFCLPGRYWICWVAIGDQCDKKNDKCGENALPTFKTMSEVWIATSNCIKNQAWAWDTTLKVCANFLGEKLTGAKLSMEEKKSNMCHYLIVIYTALVSCYKCMCLWGIILTWCVSVGQFPRSSCILWGYLVLTLQLGGIMGDYP